MALWKARVSTGVRVYFKVVRNGALVSGLATGLFTVVLINPADTASTTLAVTGSTQQGGVYYVDVPSGFLTTNGAGHYGLSIGVHKPNPQPIDDEILESVEVTARDLDDLATPQDVLDNTDTVVGYIGQKIV